MLNDGGAVVQGPGRDEDLHQQAGGDARIDADAGFGELAEIGFALDQDDGADAVLGEGFGGAGELVDQKSALAVGDGLENLPLADARQAAADVVLKDDDDDEQERADEIIEDPGQGFEVKELGTEEGEGDEPEPDQDLLRPGAADEQQHPINHIGDDKDIGGRHQHGQDSCPGQEAEIHP